MRSESSGGRSLQDRPPPEPGLLLRLFEVFLFEVFLFEVFLFEVFLFEVLFKALGTLAAAAIEGRGVPLERVSPGIKNNYNVISRLRTALTKAGLPRDVISTDGHGTYRLEIPPANITVDREAMKRHFSKLASQLVSGA